MWVFVANTYQSRNPFRSPIHCCTALQNLDAIQADDIAKPSCIRSIDIILVMIKNYVAREGYPYYYVSIMRFLVL